MEYEWTFGGCTVGGREWLRTASNSGAKVSRIWRGRIEEIYIYIYKRKKKKKRDMRKIVKEERRGKKKGKSTSVEERMEKEEGEGEEVGGTIRWKNVIERS